MIPFNDISRRALNKEGHMLASKNAGSERGLFVHRTKMEVYLLHKTMHKHLDYLTFRKLDRLSLRVVVRASFENSRALTMFSYQCHGFLCTSL